MNIKNKSYNFTNSQKILTGLIFFLIAVILPAQAEKDFYWQDSPKKVSFTEKRAFIFHRDQSSASTVVKVFFIGGKRAEPRDKRGLASITVRLMTSIPDAAETWKLMHAGAVFSGEVNEDYAVITVKCLSEYLPETLKVLTKVMKKPLFSGLRINNIKKNLKSRQKSEKEDPEQLLHLTALDAFFMNDGYCGSVYGDPVSLKAIKKKDAAGFYNRYFNAANMVIAVSSDLHESQVKRIISAFFAGFPGGETTPPVLEPVKASIPAREKFFLQKEKAQTLICFAALLPGMSPGNFVSAFLLENLLGKGIGSKLWQLRSRHGLAYGLEAGLSQFRDAGILKIYLKTGNEKKEQAYQTLKSFIVNFSRQGITAVELAAAKVHAGTDFLRMNETKEKRTIHLGYFEALGPGYEFLRDFFPELEKISLEQFNAYIKKVLQPENLVEIIIGPADIPKSTT